MVRPDTEAVGPVTHVGYVTAGWSLPLLLLGGYALSVLRRGRRLSERVAPADRRWSADQRAKYAKGGSPL